MERTTKPTLLFIYIYLNGFLRGLLSLRVGACLCVGISPAKAMEWTDNIVTVTPRPQPWLLF